MSIHIDTYYKSFKRYKLCCKNYISCILGHLYIIYIKNILNF